MMLIAEVARQEGVFDWTAALAVEHARGSPQRLFGLVYAVGTVEKRLTSRSFLRAALRRCLPSRVQRPCLKLPLRAPDGPPEPVAPPCIRQRARPLTAACRQGRPVRVLAPQRGAFAIVASRRAMSA
jgi:hypothetical protein